MHSPIETPDIYIHLVGPQGGGKTALMATLLNKTYKQLNQDKLAKIQGDKIKLAGLLVAINEKPHNHYEVTGHHHPFGIVVIVADSTSPTFKKDVSEFASFLKGSYPSCLKVLIATKSDLEDHLSNQEVSNCGREEKMDAAFLVNASDPKIKIDFESIVKQAMALKKVLVEIRKAIYDYSRAISDLKTMLAQQNALLSKAWSWSRDHYQNQIMLITELKLSLENDPRKTMGEHMSELTNNHIQLFNSDRRLLQIFKSLESKDYPKLTEMPAVKKNSF